MLTQEQLKRLYPLCDHPRFGKILDDAIQIWKKEKVQPKREIFGIEFKNKFFELDEEIKLINDVYYCCLLGAAMIGKENKLLDNKNIVNRNVEFYKKCAEYYNLTELEIVHIINGFDNPEDFIKPDEFYNDAEKFGNDVYLAIWDEKVDRNAVP